MLTLTFVFEMFLKRVFLIVGVDPFDDLKNQVWLKIEACRIACFDRKSILTEHLILR